jgi:hypothetical protein
MKQVLFFCCSNLFAVTAVKEASILIIAVAVFAVFIVSIGQSND